jgi:hypothetical protein
LRQLPEQTGTKSQSDAATDIEEMPQGMAIALDSVVKIKTRTSQVEI